MFGMKVKHYSNCFGSDVNHQILSEFGESNTDITHYRPDISVMRGKVLAGTASGARKLLYDFEDGKDVGDNVGMYLRQKYVDMADIDNAYKSVLKDLKSKAAADQEALKAEYEKQKAALEAAKEQKTTNMSDNSNNTTE